MEDREITPSQNVNSAKSTANGIASVHLKESGRISKATSSTLYCRSIVQYESGVISGGYLWREKEGRRGQENRG